MNADAKIKRDKNSFIQVILSKIELAQSFHQRIALSITSKRILNHVVLKFYLRKRYNKLFLYIRLFDKFSNRNERHKFYLDLPKLIPALALTSIKGHYTGWLLELTPENKPQLIKLLKLIVLLANPKDFYRKFQKTTYSYFNYPETSQVPIHFNIKKETLLDLRCYDLFKTLEDIEKRCAITSLQQ